MFKRLSNGLLSPKETAKYYTDSFGKVFLYFLLLVFFIMVPTVVSLVTADVVPNSLKTEIKEAFLGEEVPFIIEDGILKNVNSDETFVYTNDHVSTFIIEVTEDIDQTKTNFEKPSIVLASDGVYMKFSIMDEKIFDYTKYDYLKNIDFDDPDIFKDSSFWNKIFDVLYQELNEIRGFTITFNTIYNIIYWVVWMFIFAIIISLFAKFRTGGYLKFWSIVKVTIYNLTPFIFCLIFAILFNLRFLTYLGYLISAVFNIITINEVLKRLYLNRNEGE